MSVAKENSDERLDLIALGNEILKQLKNIYPNTISLRARKAGDIVEKLGDWVIVAGDLNPGRASRNQRFVFVVLYKNDLVLKSYYFEVSAGLYMDTDVLIPAIRERIETNRL